MVFVMRIAETATGSGLATTLIDLAHRQHTIPIAQSESVHAVGHIVLVLRYTAVASRQGSHECLDQFVEQISVKSGYL